MSDPKSKWSSKDQKWTPKAQEIINKFGLNPDRTIYWGADRLVQTNPADAISASKGFEETSGKSQGVTGGCGQSPDNVPGKK